MLLDVFFPTAWTRILSVFFCTLFFFNLISCRLFHTYKSDADSLIKHLSRWFKETFWFILLIRFKESWLTLERLFNSSIIYIIGGSVCNTCLKESVCFPWYLVTAFAKIAAPISAVFLKSFSSMTAFGDHIFSQSP